MTLPKPPLDITHQRALDRAEALSHTVVEAFTEKLRKEIEKHGGFLGLRHLDDIEAEFKAKSKQLSQAFAQAFDDAAREQEELRWHAIKRPAFDRLMVKRFEHLLMYKSPDGRTHGAVSRRMLPGFFLALNMMLGPEAIETYQARSDRAVERIMNGQIPIDWNRVDGDGEIEDIVLDAQYAIAQYFDDPPKRFQWFIHITNSHMAPDPYANDSEASWELGHRALHVLINALLSDLRTVVHDDRAWASFIERHPEADRIKMETILARLD